MFQEFITLSLVKIVVIFQVIYFSKVCIILLLIRNKIQIVTMAFKNPYNLVWMTFPLYINLMPCIQQLYDSSKLFELPGLHTFIHFCFLFQNVLSPLPAKHTPKPHLKQVSPVELYPFVSSQNKLYPAFGTNNQLRQLRCGLTVHCGFHVGVYILFHIPFWFCAS